MHYTSLYHIIPYHIMSQRVWSSDPQNLRPVTATPCSTSERYPAPSAESARYKWTLCTCWGQKLFILSRGWEKTKQIDRLTNGCQHYQNASKIDMSQPTSVSQLPSAPAAQVGVTRKRRHQAPKGPSPNPRVVQWWNIWEVSWVKWWWESNI